MFPLEESHDIIRTSASDIELYEKIEKAYAEYG